MKPYTAVLYRIIFPVVIVVAAACGLGVYLKSNWPLSIGAVAAAVFTFGFFITAPGNQEHGEAKLRNAIAAAIVVEYLVIVGMVAFFTVGPEQLPPITQTIVSSFTSIVGVVIAFYFGSSAYLEAQRQKEYKGQSSQTGRSPGGNAESGIGKTHAAVSDTER